MVSKPGPPSHTLAPEDYPVQKLMVMREAVAESAGALSPMPTTTDSPLLPVHIAVLGVSSCLKPLRCQMLTSSFDPNSFRLSDRWIEIGHRPPEHQKNLALTRAPKKY